MFLNHFQSASSTFSSIYCNQYSISYVTQNATLFFLNSQHLIKTSFRKWSVDICLQKVLSALKRALVDRMLVSTFKHSQGMCLKHF